MSEKNTDFEALDDFLEPYLELPARGKDGKLRTYRIEDPSAEDGLKIERITTLAARLASGGKAGDTTVLDDEEELNLYRMCLGGSYEPMMRELGWEMFKHCSLVAMYWITVGKEAAVEYWKTGSQGKAPNRADRRRASRGSSASAAANTTRSPASTSGTKAGSKRRKKARPRT